MRVLALMYHRVFPGHHIDPNTFEQQIQILKKKFKPLTLKQMIEFANGNLKLDRDGFTITFDDGWADNFIYAYPILKRYNVPATIFVPTAFISEKIREPRARLRNSLEQGIKEAAETGYSYEFLTWKEIQLMSPLISIESHGHKHIHHPKNSQNTIINDLDKSIEIIKQKANKTSRYLAWPFGEYRKSEIELAKRAGFESCLTVKQGFVRSGDDPYELKRFSPPRNIRMFNLAISGRVGMIIYRLAIKFNSILNRITD